MTIDPKTLKDGDIVHVRGFVSIFAGDVAEVILDKDCRRIGIDVDDLDIVHVEPRPIKVGDTVNWPESCQDWHVVAVERGFAWVMPNGEDSAMGLVRPLDKLRRP